MTIIYFENNPLYSNSPQAATSSASTFSSIYATNEDDSKGLTKKFSDAVAQMEDRSRSRAVRGTTAPSLPVAPFAECTRLD